MVRVSEPRPADGRRKRPTFALNIVTATLALVAFIWLADSPAEAASLTSMNRVNVTASEEEESSTPAPTDAPRERIAAPEFWVLGAIMLVVVVGSGVGILVVMPTMRPRRDRPQGPSE